MRPNENLKTHVLDLNYRFAKADSEEIVRASLQENLIGKLALVSSFGAESAVLLHLVAKHNPDTPVIFIDSEFLFEETIDYLNRLASELGLTDIRRIRPDPEQVARLDPDGELHKKNADLCCNLRKTLPLERALGEFSGWISGRKRHQSLSRRHLEYFELDPASNHIKINPLIHWSPEELSNYMRDNSLPRHPLVKQGYSSIGCKPCTTKTLASEDRRAGRWRGEEKDECGIHFVNGNIVRESIKG